MMKLLKKYWIPITIVIVILIVVLLYFRNKKQNRQGSTGPTDGYQNVFTVGRFDHKPGQEVAVTLQERPPMGTVVEGDSIRIENSGPYNGTFTVKKAWEDGSGNLGALFVDIPGTDLLPDDTRQIGYAGIGKIYHL